MLLQPPLDMKKISEYFVPSTVLVKANRRYNGTQTNHCFTTAVARIRSTILRLLRCLRDSDLFYRRILLPRALFILRHSVSCPKRLRFIFHASSPIFSHHNRQNHYMGCLSLDHNHQYNSRDVLLDSDGHRKLDRGRNRDGDEDRRDDFTIFR